MKKLYIVSLGPGDYELITLKAMKCLFSSDTILITDRGNFKLTRSYKIIEGLFSDKDFNRDGVDIPNVVSLRTSMSHKRLDWEEQAKKLISLFGESDQVLSYVTLGDAGIYSSAYYLLEILKESFPKVYPLVEVVPGISSFSLASSRARVPLCLGSEGLLVLPWRNSLPDGDITKVFMRPNSLGASELVGKDNSEVLYFENLCFSDEKFIEGLPSYSKFPYLSLLIDFARDVD